jgi:hypothetical protein
VSKVLSAYVFSAAVLRRERNFLLLCTRLCSALFLLQGRLLAGDQVTVQLRQNGEHAELNWHATLQLPVSASFPAYTILQSLDLRSWQPVGQPINGSIGVSDEALRLALPPAGDHAFYRVVATIQPAGDGQFGDAIFGYATQFSRELQRVGQLSLDKFVAQYGLTNQYLSSIQFNPFTARFWDLFNIDPAVYNATNSTDPRLTDFRLTTNELAVFQTNGFVVLPRLGSYSFADVFYKVYSDELPVFVSTDSILQAWHRSYMAMLEEIEETLLSVELQSVLQRMAVEVPRLWSESQGTAVQDGILDADLFFTVAQSLITGAKYPSQLGQTDQVNTLLTAVSNLQPAQVTLFGSDRLVDFSQFQVRGHYTTSTRLGRYFQAMMWCSLADFRVTGSTNRNSLRELSGAVAMNHLMNRSGEFRDWQQVDDTVQMFVGASDSMNFAQLVDLLYASGMAWPGDYTTNGLQNLQARIMAGQLGVQNIRSGYFWSPLTREQIKLPRSFTFLGQRFIVDGWAQSKVVFDDVIWDDNGIPGFEDKVMRRVPSGLDVAFSVFANSQVVPEIAARISQTNLTLADGRAFFRDGLRYQHNLAALRNVLDSQVAEAWTNNIYSSWLGCLRELSGPTTEPQYPQSMRTRSWAMKTLNTQLASWTELRHDTVLYAKQPYTGLILCGYPDGYVEPRPGFWLKMREMALRTKALVSTMPSVGSFVFEPNDFNDQAFSNSYANMWANRVQTLDQFATTMSTLQAISESELAGIPLTTNQALFLKGIVENPGSAYTGAKTYSGWYPALFYRNSRAAHSVEYSCDRWDALVTDVHTDPPESKVADPGSILHEAVGNVHLLLIAVDCGSDAAVYAGPVLSHYEFELGPFTRQTDEGWKGQVGPGNLPPQPDWTRSYLVPSFYSVPSGIR